MPAAPARYSHDHGSASRRRSSFAKAKVTQKNTPVMTPAEKQILNTPDSSGKDVTKAA
ncbi:hypothetical protein [Vibrio quintilis]|uniref:hypothetical protein n=1 Tax=Vibrio quintilis TaxID=1117707 RepID=UPI0013565333|nr:hypothetical protein [Vibrio quintilis]